MHQFWLYISLRKKYYEMQVQKVEQDGTDSVSQEQQYDQSRLCRFLECRPFDWIHQTTDDQINGYLLQIFKLYIDHLVPPMHYDTHCNTCLI